MDVRIFPTHLLEILSEVVTGLDGCVQELATSFPVPQGIMRNGAFVFRHLRQQQDSLLMPFLKLVKIASHNNAALVLVRAGYVNEVNALCRMIDEACDDIHFFERAHGADGHPSELQRRYMIEFYQEEFSGSDLVKSHQVRDRVPRRKILAAIARSRRGDADGSHSRLEVDVGRVLFGAFSGYVHGAYVHLMELFDGKLGRYCTGGLAGTPAIQGCLTSQSHYVYRSLLAVESVAYRANRNDVVARCLDLQISLARQTHCVSPDEIQKMEAQRRERPLS